MIYTGQLSVVVRGAFETVDEDEARLNFGRVRGVGIDGGSAF